MPGVPLPLSGPSGPVRGQVTQIIAGESSGALVRRSILPGGVRVLTEQMPGLRSASFGCWVDKGSRDEHAGTFGSTHFLEHLLFKGTQRRSALQIATAFDAVGGEANAVTGKEYTCYYARVLDDDLPLAVDVITDMVTSATIAADDLENERGVILSELAMNDDDPSDVVHEKFVEQVFGTHPLGRPIGGTPETIAAIDRAHVWAHYSQYYTSPDLVFTAAGGVDHDQVCDAVLAELDRIGRAGDRQVEPHPRRPVTTTALGAEHGTRRVVRRGTEQAHVVLGGTALTATDPRRYTLSVLNVVLGGGMSSRLFQEVRERRGLAYSVYSFTANYSDSGYFGLYAGCAPAKVDEVTSLLSAELERLAAGGVAGDELERGIGQLAGGLVLGLEDSGSRMSRLGKAELVHGEYVGLDEALARIRAVTADDVQALAADLAARPRSLTVVGPLDEDRELTA